MHRFGILGVALLSLLATTACTRSITLEYTPGVTLDKAIKSSPAKVGIARFEDKRAWVKPGDKQSESFLASEGAWKFALSYKGKDYMPVNALLQELFVDEFQRSGLKAQKLENTEAFGKDDLVEFGKQAQVDYVLSGQILSFEFDNDAGMVTVSSRRTVTLAIELSRVDGKTSSGQQVFTGTNNEDEGLGVLHSTNVEKLVHSVFKDVLKQVIVKVSDQLAVDAEHIALRVRVDGVEHPLQASAFLAQAGD
jgi:hypothetical protein